MKPFNRLNSNLTNNEIGSILFLRQTFCLFLFWLLILFSFSTSLEASPRYDGKLRIAVLDLEAKGIAKLEVEILSNHMRNEISRTGAVTPIGPIEIQEILDKQGFQKSKITSVQWAKEAGKILGVHQVLNGSLGMIGESYVIDARLFDVETGAIVKSITRAYRGEVNGLILEIEKLAWDITGINQKSARIASKSRTTDNFSMVVANISPITIPNPTTKAIQKGRIHYPESRADKGQIQTKSLSNKVLSGFGGISGMVLGGTVLSYLIVKGLVTLVSHSSRGKKISEIGTPPAFPDIPPRPTM